MTRSPALARAEGTRAAAPWRVGGVCGVLVLGGIGLLALFGGPVGAATASPLAPFLLKSHEEPGFAVSGHPTTITKPSGLIASGSLTKSESKSFVSTLQKAGFVKAVEEGTTGSGSNEGLSLVIQFTNPAGAAGRRGLVPTGGQVGPGWDEALHCGRCSRSEGCHRDGRSGWLGQCVLVGRRLRLWFWRLRGPRDVSESGGRARAGRH